MIVLTLVIQESNGFDAFGILLPDQFQCLLKSYFFTSKISVLLTVILAGGAEDFVVHFPSISFRTLHVFLASSSNFSSFSE